MSKEIKSNLRIGIIGCGNIAKVHLNYVKGLVDLSNIALCEKDAIRLKEFAKDSGVTNNFNLLNDLIEKFKPDVVHILTPPASHRDIAIQCLNKGVHVLIEKPMCVSVEDADEIIKAAKDAKLLVCVDHMRLYESPMLRFRKIYDSGVLGEIVKISAGYSYDSKARVDTDAASRWRNKLPGASFFDVLPHPLCILEEYLPEIKLDNATLRKDNNGEIDEVLCTFSSKKAIASLHMSLNVFPLVNYVTFECSNGLVNIDFRNFLFYTRRSVGLSGPIERIIGNLSISWQIFFGTLSSIFKFIQGKLDPYDGLKYIIVDFYKAVETKSLKSIVPAEKAKKLLEITNEIFPKPGDDEKPVSRPILSTADVLVTGGTGGIGRRLVNRLLKNGLKVRVLSHRNLNDEELNSLFEGQVTLVKGDVYNFEDVSYACNGIKTVFHLAAAMKGDWNYHLDTTVTGTRNLLEAAQQKGVNKFIYVSTLNVYDAKNYPRNGQINEEFQYEDHPEKRGNYSGAKLMAEKIVLEYIENKNMLISIVRPGLVYGHNDIILPKDIGIRVGKRLLVVFGGGRKIPLVYVENLIDALMLFMKKEKQSFNVFNIVDEDYPTQRAYINKFKHITGERFFCFYLPMVFVKFGFWTIEVIVFLLMKKKISLIYKLKCISKNVIHSTERIKSCFSWKQNINFSKGLLINIQDSCKK
ncbi:MAG: SDR family NAD(P)-dependent oxidoreductase [Candidatus Omnitrophica bacterium]|nr:SDR family NAD(P)-dependent oxidoreductase [Candidatus Omnitrophota bacterium]